VDRPRQLTLPERRRLTLARAHEGYCSLSRRVISEAPQQESGALTNRQTDAAALSRGRA
jgi:hypothetical protein